jgi:hypothetical protein
MLEIRLDDDLQGISEEQIIRNVDFAFNDIQLTGTEKERKAIQMLELGKFNDGDSYIDRYGYKLHKSDMSVGCKAILLVSDVPNMWVDTAECGLNALTTLLNVCDTGKIILRDLECKLPTYGYSDSINVRFKGRKFSSLSKLNEYIDSM